MSPSLDSKVVLITGAASGIGRATAIQLASLGARLALSDIAQEGLEKTLEQCDGSKEKHDASICNVASSDDCNRCVQRAVDKFGTIDFVFNCAGVNPTAYPLVETTDEYWSKLIDTNLKGSYSIMRSAIPHLKSGSVIVNTSSCMGIRPANQMAIYCASKFGVIGLSKAMAIELGPQGIRVNVIAPGYINTPTNSNVMGGAEAIKEANNLMSMGRMGTPEEIAKVVAFLFSDDSSYMNGSVVEVNGGMP